MRKTLLILFAFTAALAVYAAQTGEELFYSKCSTCHGSALALNKQKSPEQWTSTIKRMEKHGLDISSSETKAIVQFLTGGK